MQRHFWKSTLELVNFEKIVEAKNPWSQFFKTTKIKNAYEQRNTHHMHNNLCVNRFFKNDIDKVLIVTLDFRNSSPSLSSWYFQTFLMLSISICSWPLFPLLKANCQILTSKTKKDPTWAQCVWWEMTLFPRRSSGGMSSWNAAQRRCRWRSWLTSWQPAT